MLSSKYCMIYAVHDCYPNMSNSNCQIQICKGKWHLGHCDTRYTPPYRGFDTFLGSYSGAVDHWSREGGLSGRRGYDLRNGTEISQYGRDLYSADLYARRAEEVIRESSQPYFLYVSLTMVHAPFQVIYLNVYSECVNTIQALLQDDKERGVATKPSLRLKQSMVKALDKAVGRIVAAVKASEAGESGTVVVFMSDNGGRLLSDHPELQPNLPLKGGKGEVYEGGTRVPGLVWGGGTPRNATYSGLFHMVDWVATLTKLAGAGEVPKNLDSLDQGGGIWKGEASPRTEMVYNVDEGGLPGVTGKQESKWQVAVRRGDFKLILGAVGMIKRDGSSKNSLKTRVRELYNLARDPNEENNLLLRKSNSFYQRKGEELEEWSRSVAEEMAPVNFGLSSDLGLPLNLGGVIGSGWCQAVTQNFCTR